MKADFGTRLLPAPREATPFDGAFAVGRQTIVHCPPALDEVANWLVETLERAMGFSLNRGERQSDVIRLRLDDSQKFDGDEAYRIEVSPLRIEIAARTPQGVIRGIQTLRQLLPNDVFATSPVGERSWSVPCCLIEDAPAFRWRGMMLDCARHFMPIEFIYKWIDLLSLHKLNVFHWHLTDDQGWRIEIKKYPRLTEVGAWRSQTLIGHALPKRDYDTFDGQRHGGFYTQQQVRAIVRYAAQRGVTIVPEIEMPGHAQAAIAAYPELGNLDHSLDVWTVWGINPNIVNVEDATIQFCKDVLDEVIELFPSEFIHVGGDEAVKDQWRTSPAAQQKIRDLGLRNEDELQGWFMRQINDHLLLRGRRMIGWDEILDGTLPAGAAVMSWRGEDGGFAAARTGHDVVMSPSQSVYFDHYQTADRAGEPLAIGGCTTLRDVYAYQPAPADLADAARPHILGAQANLWTEYVPTPAQAEYMAFPRACALAEILWSDNQRDWTDFQKRLDRHLQRLQVLAVNYRR